MYRLDGVMVPKSPTPSLSLDYVATRLDHAAETPEGYTTL